MPSLLGTDVAANYGRMISPENYSVDGSNVRTWTGPYTQFSTRELTFLKIVATSDGSTAINFSTSYTGALSNFSKTVRAIQTVAEVYAVGTPDSTGFIVIVADDTANKAEVNSNEQPTGSPWYGVVEAAIVAALGGGSATATVTELAFDGVAIS